MDSVQFRAASGSPLKTVNPPTTDYSSGSDLSDLEFDATSPRVNGVNGVNGLSLRLPVENNLPESDNEAEPSDEESAVESLIQDVFEDMGYDALFDGEPGTCSLEEAGHYRHLLRTVGPEEFCEQTVYKETITAKKLLTAFGVRPPSFLEGQPDEAYYSLLSLAISRELSKRIKLRQYNSVDDAVDLIKKSQNIIVITGAGISTSLGIPDFRSKDIGLYAQLAHLGLQDPQQVFDIELFRNDPTIFFSVAKDILPDTSRFTPTHAFIHMLQEKGKLLTNYSQNIDNIEAAAGIRPEKLIQCHGSFATATCVECRYKVPGEDIFDEIKAGDIPYCKICTARIQNEQKNPRKRKRTKIGMDKKKRRAGDSDDDDDDSYDIPQAGVMKPDITFFGEPLPDKFSERLTGHDKDIVDLVIVIGTSLKVAPVSEVVPYLPAHIPQMYISMQPVSHVNFDIDLLGECDVVVGELCRRAGWNLNHPMEADTKLLDIKLADGFPSRHVFNSVKTKNLPS